MYKQNMLPTLASRSISRSLIITVLFIDYSIIAMCIFVQVLFRLLYLLYGPNK